MNHRYALMTFVAITVAGVATLFHPVGMEAVCSLDLPQTKPAARIASGVFFVVLAAAYASSKKAFSFAVLAASVVTVLYIWQDAC